MCDAKLKPCPFCGQAAQVLSQHNGVAWQVGCNNTLCPMCPHVSIWDKGYAITEWNTRAADPLVEQMAKALELIAENMNADNAESYRSDDPEGAMDTVHLLAVSALAAYRAQHPEEKKEGTK